MSDEYYIRNRGRVTGPFSLEKIKTFACRGQVTKLHELSVDGVNWSPASSYTTIFDQVLRIAEAEENLAGSTSSVQNEWHYLIGEEEGGPVPAETIHQMLVAGDLHPDHLIWRQGMENWEAVEKVPQFTDAIHGINVKRTRRRQSSIVKGGSRSLAAQNPDQVTLSERVLLPLYRSRGWVLFISVFLYVWATISSIFWFVVLISGLIAWPLAGPIFALVFSAVPLILITFTAAILLNRYYLALSQHFTFREPNDLGIVFSRLHVFWVFATVVLLLLLLFSLVCLVLLLLFSPASILNGL